MQVVPAGNYLPGPNPETDLDFEDFEESGIPSDDFERSPAPSPESEVPPPPEDPNPLEALFDDVFGYMPPEDSPEAVEIYLTDEGDDGSDGSGDGNGDGGGGGDGGDDDDDDNRSNPDEESSSSSSSSSPSSSSSSGAEIITADTPPILATVVPITLTLAPETEPQTAEQDEADRAAAASAAARHRAWDVAREAAQPVEDMNDEIYDPPSAGSSAVTLSDRGSLSPRSEGSKGSAGSGGSKGSQGSITSTPSKSSSGSSSSSSGRSKASTGSQRSKTSSEKRTQKSPSPSEQLAFGTPPQGNTPNDDNIRDGAAGGERESPPAGWVQWHEKREGGAEEVDEGEGEVEEEEEEEGYGEDGYEEVEEPRLGWFGAFLGLFW